MKLEIKIYKGLFKFYDNLILNSLYFTNSFTQYFRNMNTNPEKNKLKTFENIFKLFDFGADTI